MTDDVTLASGKRAKVKLVGRDGNAFFILGATIKALRKAGATKEETDTFLTEAKSGDYDKLLRTCSRWADVS
jgi:hypothetical protein